MTTLDQAFIRAYLEESGPAAAQGGSRPQPSAPAAIEPEPEVAVQSIPPPGGVGLRLLEPAVVFATMVSIEDYSPAASGLVGARGSLSAPASTPARADKPPMPPQQPPRPNATEYDEPPAPAAIEPEPDLLPPVVGTESEKPAADPDAADFQPMLQVDGFAWSDRATSLRLAAGIQVDRLADGLAGGIAEGRNVVAIAGCRRRQGCTTLLLCAAKRLAARGLKVAMVDAHFDQPALASRLGLAPDAGLEAVLAGRNTLAEVAIESMADQMVLVPLAARSAPGAETPETEKVLRVALDKLRQSYDLVLVDLGQTGGGDDHDDSSARCECSWVDAVVLVQNVRSTPRAELVGAARRAEAAGVVPLGVVENFV